MRSTKMNEKHENVQEKHENVHEKHENVHEKHENVHNSDSETPLSVSPLNRRLDAFWVSAVYQDLPSLLCQALCRVLCTPKRSQKIC